MDEKLIDKKHVKEIFKNNNIEKGKVIEIENVENAIAEILESVLKSTKFEKHVMKIINKDLAKKMPINYKRY